MFKTVRNVFGTVLGFGCCPNCGDSWSWSPHGSITYQEFDDGSANCFMLCIKCAVSPPKIDVDRITSTLLKHDGWEQSEVDMVREVLIADYAMPTA